LPAPPEPVQAVLDVGRVARLGHLAVVDDVEAGVQLAGDDGADRLDDLVLQRRPVERDAILAGEHDLDQLLAAREAADVGGQKTLVGGHRDPRARW